MNEFEGYTLGLALMDYLPPLFSAIGLFFLSRIVYQGSNSAGQTAFFGALLVVAGGICKASWKLFIAFGNNYPILDELLFLLMGPGFVLIFAATLQWALHASHKAPKVLPVLMAAIVLGSALWMHETRPDSRIGFFILLGAVAITSTGVLITFIGHSIKQKAYLPATFIFINLSANLIMQGLARQLSDDASAQWLAQSINSASQLCFALGFWLLYKHHIKQQN